METKVSINNCKGYVIMMMVYSCLGVLTLLFQLWYSVRFFKFYGFKHKLTSMFMVFLTLSIICDITYGVSQVVIRYSDGCDEIKHSCVYYWTNWKNYFMYMNTIIVLSFTYISQILRFKNRGRSKKRVYNIMLWTTMLAILLICAIIFLIDGIKECRKDPDKTTLFTSGIIVVTGIHMVTGFFFMITLFYFYKVLKSVDESHHETTLSNKLKWRLAISVTVIVVVFETRSSMILARSINDFLENWTNDSMKNNGTLYVIYSFCYYCILSLIPTMVQIYLIKLSLSTTPRVSVGVDEYHGQSEPLIPNNFEMHSSQESESIRTVDFMELNYNTS
ncbi:unnamed protein product [Moneuplotes crassus]|uniref:Uncharacterized protein n=1 Tax=Euplotes crassus TaxID=5936 RepID=A0AAD1XM39_EUPCR|nr:unnamed protein product [Moneuplotes crassus]